MFNLKKISYYNYLFSTNSIESFYLFCPQMKFVDSFLQRSFEIRFCGNKSNNPYNLFLYKTFLNTITFQIRLIQN